MLEEVMFRTRSRLLRQLAGLAAATIVLFAVEVLTPLPAAASPPHKPAPVATKPPSNWMQIWKSLLPKPLPIPKQTKPKLPHVKTPRIAVPKPKHIPKQLAPKPLPQPKGNPAPKARKAPAQPHAPAPKAVPQTVHIRNSLAEAWHHIGATVHLPAAKKAAALASVSQALIALGGATPKPIAAGLIGDHVSQAEEYLIKAQKEVLDSKTLPIALKTTVLGQITSAQTALRTKANPAAAKAAPPKR